MSRGEGVTAARGGLVSGNKFVRLDLRSRVTHSVRYIGPRVMG